MNNDHEREFASEPGGSTPSDAPDTGGYEDNNDRSLGDYRLLWVSGSRQILSNVHHADKCAGTHCAIHNPSDHHMRDWPTHLRGSGPFDLGVFTERICEHGVGHPDPDDPFAHGIHGCCAEGCCTPPA